jgi:signal transduction histidine kinase
MSSAEAASITLPHEGPVHVRARQRWPDLIYFALAGFDLLTILLTVMLGNHIMSLYEQSVARSVAWSARVVTLVGVVRRAQEASAPGNDVFHSADVQKERLRRDQALLAYGRQRDAVLDELSRNVSGEARRKIENQIALADAEMRTIAEQSEVIFEAHQRGDYSRASSHMAEMDRTYARLSNHLLDAISGVQGVEDQNLARQVAIAKSLHILGIVVLVLISLIVVGVALYGRHLGGIMRSTAKAHDAMLAELAAANEALEHYADNVAHELRNPLNKILVSSEITLSRPRTNDEYQDALTSVIEDAQHLSGIVASLLFLAQAQMGRVDLDLQTLDLCPELELIRSYFEATAQQAGVQLSVDCPPGTVLRADRALLQRAIINLVSNAISHTPAGGAVTIGAAAGEAYATIEVADTGEGMSAYVQARVFDRFYRADPARATRSGRLGLGLPIAKSIIDLHGGRISIVSGPNVGTKVAIHLAARPYERVITP